MITPTQAAIAETVATIDTVLAETDKLRAEAVTLIADNPWCVTALGRRGIDVTP